MLLIVPPVHKSVPFTVNVPSPVSVPPLESVRFVLDEAASTVSVPPLITSVWVERQAVNLVGARRMRDDDAASQIHLHIVSGPRHAVDPLIVLPIGGNIPGPARGIDPTDHAQHAPVFERFESQAAECQA